MAFKESIKAPGSYLSQELLHDLRSVVDSKDDISDTRCDQRLNLVYNHGLVGELDKRLGESEGL